jgi:hypothetical protein
VRATQLNVITIQDSTSSRLLPGTATAAVVVVVVVVVVAVVVVVGKSGLTPTEVFALATPKSHTLCLTCSVVVAVAVDAQKISHNAQG